MLKVGQKVTATDAMTFEHRKSDEGFVTFSDDMGSYVTWMSDQKSVFHYSNEVIAA